MNRYQTRRLDGMDESWLLAVVLANCPTVLQAETELAEPNNERCELRVWLPGQAHPHETVFRERVADHDEAGVVERLRGLGWTQASSAPPVDLESAIQAAEQAFAGYAS